jgi:hypothetical protein
LEVRVGAAGEDQPRGRAEEADASRLEDAHDLRAHHGGPRQVLDDFGEEDEVDAGRGEGEGLGYAADLLDLCPAQLHETP